MSYGAAKVYFDGSHYIAIPHTTRSVGRRPKPPEEEISVEETTDVSLETAEEESLAESAVSEVNAGSDTEAEQAPEKAEKPVPAPPKARKMTRKSLFEELYRKYLNLPRQKRKKTIANEMRPYFKTEILANRYVELNFERKQRNLICRRIRMVRKANLQAFNYFVTFTFSDELHTEQSFRKKLKNCLSLFAYRRSWKYIGVWERSPEKNRLHFHGVFDIPEGTLPGEMEEVNSYSFSAHKRQITHQNTYFAKRYGRNDFEPLDNKRRLGDAIAYLLKYLEKTGEKIVYSKGLPQFFISDIMDEDVVCRIGAEDKKLLLFDDFNCWDEGVLMGKVSKAVISQMPKAN